MFHPHGVNLLANTSATGIGFLLLPITAIFGPLASLNLGLILAPTLSAFAVMLVAQRWSRSDLATFVAGAMYGFSPFVLFHDALGHLNLTFLLVPPLVLWCVDELLTRRSHGRVRVGIVLGVLLAWQFFIGSEVFVMMGVATIVGGGVLLVASLVAERGAAVRAVARSILGFVVAGVIAALTLAAPLIYAVFGPGHYRGPVWPGTTLSNTPIRAFVTAHGGPTLWWNPSTWTFLPATYLAPGLLIVVGLGTIIWWRDRRLGTTVLLAAVMAWLALGQRYWFAAWHWLVHFPQMENVENDRFAIFLVLFMVLALARVADHLRTWRPKALAPLAVVGALAVSSFPYIYDAAHVAPYSASRLWVPQWYESHAGTLPPGHVVLGFPFFNVSANLLGVQAIYEMRFAVVGGTTPLWLVRRQGAQAPGYALLRELASTRLAPMFPPNPSQSDALAVRSALTGWRVTDVIVSMTNGPNTSSAARAPAAVELWLASVLGAPTIENGAWTWHRAVGATNWNQVGTHHD